MPAVFTAILFLAAALAAPARPQQMSVTAVPAAAAAPGSKAMLYADVVPRPGMHVYAPGATDYRIVAFKLTAPDGVTVGAVKYPKAEKLVIANDTIPVYTKAFRLAQEIAIGGTVKPQPVTVSGTIEYQACDDQVCFIPASIPVSWTIDVRAARAK